MVATSVDKSGQTTARLLQGSFPTAVGLILILVAFLLVFLPSIQWLAGEWSSTLGASSHGYLVVAISATLFFRAIPEVAAVKAAPAWWVLPILVGLSVLWLLGHVAAVAVVQAMVLPAILLTAIFAAYGLKAARPLAFPVLFFYFAIPAWEHLQFVLQTITVFVVSILIRIADLPAFVDGNRVQLSSGTFEIAGECSGLNFVVAGLSLAVLYGHLYYTRWRQRLSLMLITLIVAMIGNWIRVFVVIVIGYLSEMQSSLVVDHGTWGWILFTILMVPVYFAARRIEGHDHYKIDTATPNPENGRNTVAALVAVICMGVGPAWALTVAGTRVDTQGIQLSLPAGSPPWPGPVESRWEWKPVFAHPDAERIAQYGVNENVVLVYSNLYVSQKQDKELVYYSNRIEGAWERADLEDTVTNTLEAQSGLSFRQVVARNYAGNWLIWYRYQIDDQFETSDAWAKLRQALNTLRGKPEAGVIAFAAPCGGSCEKAATTLGDFVARIGYMVRVEYTRGKQ